MRLRIKRKHFDCLHTNFCSNCSITKQGCESCEYYKFVDSGFGWCIYNPEPVLTEWCRDICGQFKVRVTHIDTKKEP